MDILVELEGSRTLLLDSLLEVAFGILVGLEGRQGTLLLLVDSQELDIQEQDNQEHDIQEQDNQEQDNQEQVLQFGMLVVVRMLEEQLPSMGCLGRDLCRSAL
jgi:hypothetical protein